MGQIKIVRDKYAISLDIEDGPVQLTEDDFDHFIDCITGIATHERDSAIIKSNMKLSSRYLELQDIEQKKYSAAWKSGAEKHSQCALPLSRYISKQFDKKARMLDIGCGDGTTVKMLQDQGFNCYGLDVTLNGLRKDLDRTRIYTAFVWNMPWADDFFDYTFSTDVLEHLPPEMVVPTIAEIYRITRKVTTHVIATFKDNRLGYTFHLTVENIKWWQEQFGLFKKRTVAFDVIDRNDFLKANW